MLILLLHFNFCPRKSNTKTTLLTIFAVVKVLLPLRKGKSTFPSSKSKMMILAFETFETWNCKSGHWKDSWNGEKVLESRRSRDAVTISKKVLETFFHFYLLHLGLTKYHSVQKKLETYSFYAVSSGHFKWKILLL